MRRRPYTTIGIRRVPCSRCGKPSYASWQVCALGRRYVAMCAACDVALNALVLRWMKWPAAESIIRRYRAKVKDAV